MIRLSSPEKKRGNQPLREQNTPYLLLTLISAAENFVKLLFYQFIQFSTNPSPKASLTFPIIIKAFGS